MEILELQMKHFGKFSDRRVRFHSGINVIYGSNEMGKTTMHSFICGMLFGIEKQRGRASKNDEYSLREPWENPGYFAGVLRFESGGKIFRLERNFQKREKAARLICETDGEELSLEDGDLESLMEGLNESSFRNTVFIRQKGSGTDEGLAAELRNFMTNVQNTGDGDIDVNLALEHLDGKRRQLEAQNRKVLIAAAERKQEQQMRLDYVRQEIGQLRDELREAGIQEGQIKERLRREAEQGRNEREQVQAAKNSQDSRHRRQLLLIMTLGLAALLVCLLIPVTAVRAAVLAAWLVLFGIYSWHTWQRNGTGTGQPEERKPSVEEQKQHTVCEQLCWKKERILGEQKEKETLESNLLEAMEEIRESEKAEGRETEIQAVRLAMDTIRSLSDEIYKESAMQLNARISEILSEITGGRYTSVFLDAGMEVRINTPQKLLNLQQVSRGTMDQVYFALRMAVGEMLCHGEPVPVILDDAFAMYDDERLERTMNWLKKSGRQVLLFTCHRRELEI